MEFVRVAMFERFTLQIEVDPDFGQYWLACLRREGITQLSCPSFRKQTNSMGGGKMWKEFKEFAMRGNVVIRVPGVCILQVSPR